MHIKILLFCGCLIWTVSAHAGEQGFGRRQISKTILNQRRSMINNVVNVKNDAVFGREALKAVTEAPLNLQIPKPELENDVPDKVEKETVIETKKETEEKQTNNEIEQQVNAGEIKLPSQSNSKQTKFATDNKIDKATGPEYVSKKRSKNNRRASIVALKRNRMNPKNKRGKSKLRRNRRPVLRNKQRKRINNQRRKNRRNNQRRKIGNRTTNKKNKQVKNQQFGQATKPDTKVQQEKANPAPTQ